MNLNALKKLLAQKVENEHLELKEAKGTFSVLGGNTKKPKCIYGYAVAIGNEGGGKLILGINNKKSIVGTQACRDIENVKSKIYAKLHLRIDIDEVFTLEKKRIDSHSYPKQTNRRAYKYPGKTFQTFSKN